MHACMGSAADQEGGTPRFSLSFDRAQLPGRAPFPCSATTRARLVSCAGREPASGAELPDGKLRDVHVGIPASKVKGGTQHLVKGSYVYHHYMQASTGCVVGLGGSMGAQ